MVDPSSVAPTNEKTHLDPQLQRDTQPHITLVHTSYSDEKTSYNSVPTAFTTSGVKNERYASSFDVDLEAAQTHPNTAPNSNANLAPSYPTHHFNASLPADIGSGAINPGDLKEVDLADGGRIGGPTPGRRGRMRRRAQQALYADAQPALRRASSLPARPPLTTTMDGGGPQPSFAQTLNTLLVPAKKLAQPPGWKDSAINILKYSYINVLLIFIPISWGVHYADLSPTLQFVFSFLAIIPCAALLGFATEEIAIRVGQVLGGLVNATLGNAVELIISILALVKGELRVVQASMLGSILSNCLLVLGMCFFAGGFRFHEQGYGVRAAQLNISLLSISVFSIVIPAAFHSSLNFDRKATITEENDRTNSVLIISRGTAIILLFVYAAYLLFQLWTHAYIYSSEASAHHSAQTYQGAGIDGPGAPPGQRVFRMPHLPSLPSITIYGHSTDSNSSSSSRRSRSSSSSSSSSSSASSVSTIEGEEVPKLKAHATILLLLVITIITGFTAEILVGSIDGLTATGHISREFVALILLPLVGNAAEHVTAVTVSVKNKLDLAITVAVGSSIQIALFVIPFLVILGWMIGQPLSLFFDIFETIVVFVSVLVVNYAISDGRTNWLEGMVLMVVYLLIALACWFYPGTGAL